MGAIFHMFPGIGSPSRGELIATYGPGIFVEMGNAAPEFFRIPEGSCWIIDHHAQVNRDVTLSAGQQALRGLKIGYAEAFKHDREFSPDVYMQRCDQDDALVHYAMNHQHRIREEQDPVYQKHLHELYDTAGTLDATAGMYPYDPRSEIMEHLAWAFTPFTKLRKSGEIDRKDPETYLSVVSEMSGNLALILAGKGERRPLDTEYKVLGGGELRGYAPYKWLMIEEIGEHGRIGAYHDNIKRGVGAYIIARQQQNGGMQVTISRLSEAVEFDVPFLYGYFNRLEHCPPNDRWGGGKTVGGSPPVAGTSLTIDALQHHISEEPWLACAARRTS